MHKRYIQIRIGTQKHNILLFVISIQMLFILLSIWLCRLTEKPGWFKVSHIISMLALEDEHPARSKGLR